MTRRVTALIAKTRHTQSYEIAELNEAQRVLRDIKSRQDALSMREALIIGAGGFRIACGEYTAREISMGTGLASRRVQELTKISMESALLEQAKADALRKMAEIQGRLARTSRLLTHLCSIK